MKSSLPLSLAFLALSLPLQPGRGAAPEEYKGDVTDVRTIRDYKEVPGSALLWEPYIAAWKPKHLVVAFGAGIPGKTDMGDILASVSTTDGDKWSEPAYVFDHHQHFGAMQFAYANAVLYRPPGQDVIWCFAMRCPMNYAHSEDSQLVGAFSADGGLSWTQVELAMAYTGPLIIVGGIQRIMENGRPLYLLPAHCNSRRSDPAGMRHQFMLCSTSLLEWRLAGQINAPDITPPVFLHEGNLAEGDAEGELKVVMRTSRADKEGAALDPPRAFSSVSKDGGRGWSVAQQEPDLWNSVSKGFFGRVSSGEHVYVYSDGPAWSRMALRYKIQAPGAGGAWGEEKTFYEAGIHNSYPTLIEVAPGDFRAVWDSGNETRTRTHICFGKLRIGGGAKK